MPTSEPLLAVLGTDVLCVQGSTLVPNTADRGSDVGQMFPKLMTMEGGGGCFVLSVLEVGALGAEEKMEF